MYTILGLGTQGKAILHYLLTHTNEEVHTYDPAHLIFNRDDHPRWTHYRQAYSPLIGIPKKDSTRHVFISCLPTEHNLNIAQRCMEHEYDYIDLGGDVETTRAIEKHAESWSSSSVIVPDCGIAPGLVSSVAAWGANRGFTEVDLFCGGLPVEPQTPLSYVLAFSPQGVIKEYNGICEVITGGKHEYRPALADPELVFIPGLGVLEARNTCSSISTAARHLDLEEFWYKTLRYTGHWQYVMDWIIGFPDSVERMAKLALPLSSDNPDLIVLRAEFSDPSILEDETHTWRWDYNHELGIGAMAEITGYTVASVATMIHDDVLAPGFVHMHDIDFEELQKRIKLCPNQFKEI